MSNPPWLKVFQWCGEEIRMPAQVSSTSLDHGSELRGLWSGREKKKRRNGMTRKRVENREGSLGYPGFVRPVFTKDSKPLGKRKRSLGHLGIMTPVLT
ncbi:hypothetical protein TNCV_3555061 [Trichonephila clavipes]|nr:hypothetical protein TNCV_3555061 [Trichonephila clavipes]